ncbi:MAG TPA: 30S ribosomal protein S12 methylthiotransferase RimO [Candidatus Omnitrophota bacterium]|nr:30S ribosomal protein S12 methylthiotransferase RimO [Candidatus Omnitrophota bacterium]
MGIKTKRHQARIPATVSIGILSLGCPKNLVDSEQMLGKLKARGYRMAEHVTNCDIAVINTCAFIQDARRESIDSILEIVELKKRGAVKAVIVTGCLPQKYYRELSDEIREIDAILGTGAFHRIDEVIAKISKGEKVVAVEDSRLAYDYASPRLSLTPAHFRYIKIGEGCNHRCSFCIIPELRGSYRSRAPEEIVAEVKGFVPEGLKEANLISQDTTYYGFDRPDGERLGALLKSLDRIDGLGWIRLLYTHPLHLTDEILDGIADSGKICKYIDVPFQHVNDRILRDMKRGTDKRFILSLLERMRKKIPSLAVRTSLIVGYPGETEDEFEELCDFVRSEKFERLGVFQYSPGDDEASGFPGQIPPKVRERRRHILMTLQQEIAFRRNESLAGNIFEVLTDERDAETGDVLGRAYFDAPEIDGRVIIPDPAKQIRIGEFYRVRITGARDYDLQGEVI